MNRFFTVIAVGLIALTARAHHFGWGLDVGSTVDLSGQDLSSFNIGATLGYKSAALQILGAGASMNIGVSNGGVRMFPVFAVVRTAFSAKKSYRCFLEAKGGVSFSQLNQGGGSQTNPYGSVGVGINLATGSTFKSYIVVSYTYVGLNSVTFTPHEHLRPLHGVTAGIGVNF